MAFAGWARIVPMFEARGRCTWLPNTARKSWLRCCLQRVPEWMWWLTLAMASKHFFWIHFWIWASHFPKMSCSHMFLGVYIFCFLFSTSCKLCTILTSLMKLQSNGLGDCHQRLRPHAVACGRIHRPRSSSSTAPHSHRRNRLWPWNRQAFWDHEVMKFEANMQTLRDVFLVFRPSDGFDFCHWPLVLMTHVSNRKNMNKNEPTPLFFCLSPNVSAPRRNPARLRRIQGQCARALCFGSWRQRPWPWNSSCSKFVQRSERLGFEGAESMDIVMQRHGQPPRGQTQLHLEASYGDVAAVERLLAAGVAADAVDNEGFGLGTVEIVQQITKLCSGECGCGLRLILMFCSNFRMSDDPVLKKILWSLVHVLKAQEESVFLSW